MNDPFRRFQQQPWLPLAKIAALTMVVTLSVEFLLISAADRSKAFSAILELMFASLLGTLLPVLAAVGVGALAVYLCERLAPDVYLNAGSLWALVLCAIVGVGLKSIAPIPQVLVPFSSTTAMGIVIGVFWKGRPYWRR